MRKRIEWSISPVHSMSESQDLSMSQNPDIYLVHVFVKVRGQSMKNALQVLVPLTAEQTLHCSKNDKSSMDVKKSV